MLVSQHPGRIRRNPQRSPGKHGDDPELPADPPERVIFAAQSRLTRGRIRTDTGRTVALTMPTANRVHLVMALEAGNSGGRSTLVAAMYG